MSLGSGPIPRTVQASKAIGRHSATAKNPSTQPGTLKDFFANKEALQKPDPSADSKAPLMGQPHKQNGERNEEMKDGISKVACTMKELKKVWYECVYCYAKFTRKS